MYDFGQARHFMLTPRKRVGPLQNLPRAGEAWHWIGMPKQIALTLWSLIAAGLFAFGAAALIIAH
jgi:hypothetical protein